MISVKDWHKRACKTWSSRPCGGCSGGYSAPPLFILGIFSAGIPIYRRFGRSFPLGVPCPIFRVYLARCTVLRATACHSTSWSSNLSQMKHRAMLCVCFNDRSRLTTMFLAVPQSGLTRSFPGSGLTHSLGEFGRCSSVPACTDRLVFRAYVVLCNRCPHNPGSDLSARSFLKGGVCRTLPDIVYRADCRRFCPTVQM